MTDFDRLDRISLLLAVCGLAVVYTASAVYTPPNVDVRALDESYLGETILVTGTVSSHTVHDGTQFITIKDGEERLSVVYFGNKDLDITAGGAYTMEGDVDVYEGELQIILRNIEPKSKK